jgi:hypothetical protein
MSMVPSAFIQAWKCGKLNNCKIDETRRWSWWVERSMTSQMLVRKRRPASPF